MSRFLIFGLLFTFLVYHALSVTVQELVAQRERLLAEESMRILGGGLTLNANEQLVNNILMEDKTIVYDQSIADLNFIPAIHFFLSKPEMLKSKVFNFIRQMPKRNIFIWQHFLFWI